MIASLFLLLLQGAADTTLASNAVATSTASSSLSTAITLASTFAATSTASSNLSTKITFASAVGSIAVATSTLSGGAAGGALVRNQRMQFGFRIGF